MLQSVQGGIRDERVKEKLLKRKILLVDDNFATLLNIQRSLVELGYDVVTARHGEHACVLLERDPCAADVVILDRNMPVLDGISTVQRLAANPQLRSIPVVMVTGADSVQEIREGLEAGVFYYLPKPVSLEALKTILVAAMRQAQKNRALTQESLRTHPPYELLQLCTFSFQTPEEVDELSVYLANIFPDPSRALNGIAELMLNAVEHGNLEIGYESKSRLLASGALESEIERRLRSPDFAARHAEASIVRKPEGVYLSILDKGPGFDWKNYVGVSLGRACHSHGRGIARARALSFDSLSYNAAGNKVVGFMSSQAKIDW